jgi:predicted phosphodiesterase
MVARKLVLTLLLVLGLALGSLVGAGGQPAERVGLTFLGWSDQHVLPNGDYSHCLSSVEAMNALPGTAYPEAIGGEVDQPAFVLSAGDLTEWPSHAAVEGYKKLVALLPWPSEEIAGNHDDGGESPSDTMLDFLREKHGGLNYAFDRGGATTPEGPVPEEAMTFLKDDLAKLTEDQPTIVVMHHCSDSLTNKAEVLAALKGRNVLAVLGGHYHKAVHEELGGIAFYQLPSPKSDDPGVTVVRVTPERLTICTRSVKSSAWMDRVTVDKAIGRDGG